MEQLCGRLPNVYWQGVELEELRQLHNFEALPPVDRLLISGSPSYRYVRQESPLWSALHQGVLTTGSLPQSLGFFEPISSKKLGLPRSRVSHRHLLDAYHRLLLPPPHPPSAFHHPLTPTTLGQALAGTSLCDSPHSVVDEHNVAAVAKFNAAKLASSSINGQQHSHQQPPLQHSHPSVPPPGLPHGQTSERTAAAQQQPSHVQGPRHMMGRGGSSSSVHSNTSNNRKKRDKKEKTKDSMHGTLMAAATSAQDGTGVHSAGCNGCGGKDGTSDRGSAGGARSQRNVGEGSTGGVTASSAAPAVVQEDRVPDGGEDSVEAGKLRLARRLAQEGVGSICCAWGKAQEAASLYALAALLPPSSRVIEVGLYQPDCQALALALGLPPGGLPPLGASPDALLRHTMPSSTADASLAAKQGTHDWCAAASCTSSGGGSPLQPGGCRRGVGGAVHAQYVTGREQCVFEAVEVKNTCPFGEGQRRGGGSSRRSTPYQLADRGPRLGVKPEWVPQLQMHMLCTGTQSAVLLSRSATRGMHLLRMPRDDAFLELMLRVLSRLLRLNAA